MELHWKSRVLSKSAFHKKFQPTSNTDGVWAVDISCVHQTLNVVSSYYLNLRDWLLQFLVEQS